MLKNMLRFFSLRNLAWIAGGLLALLLLTTAGAIGWLMMFRPLLRPLTNREFVSSPQRLERGRYIVQNLAACLRCHSPNEMRTPLPGTAGSGRILPAPSTNPWKHSIVASNITPDPVTGIGLWTDDAIGRAVREGVDRKGRSFTFTMPSLLYRSMSDEDLASTVVYLRSLPPVRKQLPETHLVFPVQFLVRTVPKPILTAVQPDVSTAPKRGEYLVNIATCTECHGSHDFAHHAIDGLEFAGGDTMQDDATVTAPNLTPDETGTLPATPQSFREVIRTGKIGSRIFSPLMPCDQYAGLTDSDLNDIYAYLKNLRPVKHIVDRLAPATYCEVCGNRHGGGERNTK